MEFLRVYVEDDNTKALARERTIVPENGGGANPVERALRRPPGFSFRSAAPALLPPAPRLAGHGVVIPIKFMVILVG